ncbi:MAG: ribokinase [Terriglobales bacterium]
MVSAHITVVGSYATGLTMRVPRLPSTGETLLGTGYRVDFGGKGSNQAIGCARLGAQVSFVAKIGNDDFGEMALRLYQQEGIDARYLRRTSDAPTGVGFILVEENSGHNCIVIDPGANDHLSASDVLEQHAAFQNARVVLTQLEVPTATMEAALRRGRDCGAITILNPAPVRPLSHAALELVDILTPNLTEAKVLASLAPDAAAEPQEVARVLLDKGIKQIVMTLGERGAMIVSESSVANIPAIRVKPLDTTGAGDAFNAGLASALALGANLDDAVRFAVVCGGLAVTKHAVIPALPYRDHILRTYHEQGWSVPAWFSAKPQAVGTRITQ